MQAIGEEGDKDVRLDPLFILVEDRTNGEIALEVLEGLFHQRMWGSSTDIWSDHLGVSECE